MYLSDLGWARLKTHEVARYGAFAMAKQPLSKYPASALTLATTEHEARFVERQALVTEEMTRVFLGLDLLSAVPVPVNSHRALVGTAAFSLSHAPTPYAPGASAAQLVSQLGGGALGSLLTSAIATVLNAWVGGAIATLGFDSTPVVQSQVQSTWLPSRFLPAIAAAPRPHSPVGSGTGPGVGSFLLTLRDSVVVLADPWALDDGRDVGVCDVGGRDIGVCDVGVGGVGDGGVGVRDPAASARRTSGSMRGLAGDTAFATEVERFYLFRGLLPGPIQDVMRVAGDGFSLLPGDFLHAKVVSGATDFAGNTESRKKRVWPTRPLLFGLPNFAIARLRRSQRKLMEASL